ncbi:MAG: hypothetical protein AAGJ19_14730 [Myxococcota bacterium]
MRWPVFILFGACALGAWSTEAEASRLRPRPLHQSLAQADFVGRIRILEPSAESPSGRDRSSYAAHFSVKIEVVDVLQNSGMPHPKLVHCNMIRAQLEARGPVLEGCFGENLPGSCSAEYKEIAHERLNLPGELRFEDDCSAWSGRSRACLARVLCERPVAVTKWGEDGPLTFGFTVGRQEGAVVFTDVH